MLGGVQNFPFSSRQIVQHEKEKGARKERKGEGTITRKGELNGPKWLLSGTAFVMEVLRLYALGVAWGGG